MNEWLDKRLVGWQVSKCTYEAGVSKIEDSPHHHKLRLERDEEDEKNEEDGKDGRMGGWEDGRMGRMGG